MNHRVLRVTDMISATVVGDWIYFDGGEVAATPQPDREASEPSAGPCGVASDN
jgi:hypothetical protein